MRLIDADARVTVQSFDLMNEEYDQTEMTVEQALDFVTDEGCPQVVDAIPVEWIKLNIAISALVEDDDAASLLLTLVDTWHNRGWSLFDGILPAEEAKKYGIKPKK